MTDRRTFNYLVRWNRRTRLMDRRQHSGLARFLFIPVSDFFRRFVWGWL